MFYTRMVTPVHYLKQVGVLRWTFPLALFLSASLLFLVQPIAAKILLPIFGGTPAVWTICMLFFQVMLLMAYGYAWLLSQLSGTVSWRLIHIMVCLLSLYALPLHLAPELSSADPALLILKTLMTQLGLPILVVGASAPLLQYAFSQTSDTKAPDPYFLYVASNMGSLLALLSYPWIIERLLGVGDQLMYWGRLYQFYCLFIACLLITVRYQSRATQVEYEESLSWRARAEWVGLSFIPCSLMMGVTSYITTDVAATPLFWVVPLALYLLTFIVTFSTKPWISPGFVNRNVFLVFLFPILSFIYGISTIPAWQLILMNLSAFLMISLLFHHELFKKRPSTQHLTAFYVCLSLGGVLAGLFNGLLAPKVFVQAAEYPLVLLLAVICFPIKKEAKEGLTLLMTFCLLVMCVINRYTSWIPVLNHYHVIEVITLTWIITRPGSRKMAFFSFGLLFAVIFLTTFSSTHYISQQRNFYGIKRVFSQENTHYLMNQTTLHGFQIQTRDQKINGNIAYYGPVSPVITELKRTHPSLKATVLGLGAGTLLCQFQQEDEVRFVEIDEQVIQMASNPELFTYLRDCPASNHIIQQDGRMAMVQLPVASTDLIIMDAFSSDAVPVHLLTREAFAVYRDKLTPDGVLLINISNRHINLIPVMTAIAHELDLIMLYTARPEVPKLGQFPSKWVILTSNEALASNLIQKNNWHFEAGQTTQLWTDDYSNIIPLL